MTYLALARTYRPKNFADLLGQNHVVLALENALKQNRLHHAYLFTGTRGVGKTTISRILAKSLNCVGEDGQGGITAQPCGKCGVCLAIDDGRFADYLELDAASNRGVDEIQQLLEQAVYKPVQGRFKVFMIDEVHMMTNHAFNAMLKTLEEPPEYLKFVLATTDPQKVPVTVLSRCLQFNLRPIAKDVIVTGLTQVLSQEQIQAEPSALEQIASAARGSMRDALSLTDQAIAFSQAAITAQAVKQMLGSVDIDYIRQIITALAAADGQTVVAIIDGLKMQGLSAYAALEELINLSQKIAVQQLAPSKQAVSDSEQQMIHALAQQLPADETQLLYNLCLHGLHELDLAPDEYSALTMVLLRLLAFKKKTPLVKAATESATAKAPAVPATPATVGSTLAVDVADEEATILLSEPLADQVVCPKVETTLAVANAVELVLDKPPAKNISPASVESPAAVLGATKEAEDTPATPVKFSQLDNQPAERQLEAPPTPAAQVVNNHSPVSTVNEPSLADFWCELIETLASTKQLSPMLKQLALNVELVAKEPDCWQFITDNQVLSQNATLVKALTELLNQQGFAVELQIKEVKANHLEPLDTLKYRLQQRKLKATAKAKEILLADDYVRNIIETFDGKLIEQSLQLTNEN